MAEAGWYDDPLIPGGKRYWDGVQWTDHAQAPPVGTPGGAGFAGQQGGPPPFAGAQAAGGPPAFTYSDGRVNDLGEWIGRSFKMVIQQIGPLSVFAGLQLLFFAIGYLLLHQSLRRTVIDDNGIFGYDIGLGVASGAAFLTMVLVGLVATLASHHNLYGAHVGQAPGLSQSLSAGFARLLRYVGINLLLMLGFYLIIGIVVGIVIGIAVTVGDSTGIIVSVGIVAYIATLLLLLWASIKLALLTAAVSVVPKGTSALRAAWDATTGFFWPVFGRLFLLGMLLSLLYMVPYTISIFAVPALFFSQFDVLADGDIAVDGRPIDTLDVFEFADFLPNPILVVAFFGITIFLMSIVRTVSYSGSAALYADLNGPNSFGHIRR